jgi:hypothetical protein
VRWGNGLGANAFGVRGDGAPGYGAACSRETDGINGTHGTYRSHPSHRSHLIHRRCGGAGPQTPNAERRTPNAERQTPNAKRQTPNAKRQTPNAKRQTPNAKRQTPNAVSRSNDSPHDLFLGGPGEYIGTDPGLAFQRLPKSGQAFDPTFLGYVNIPILEYE